MAARKLSLRLSYLVASASGVFEFPEEPFDQIAIAVEKAAEHEASTTVALGCDVGEASLIGDPAANGIAVISLIGEEGAAAWNGGQRRLSLTAITRLALGQMQLDRQARAINQRVDLGRQTAPGTSQAAIWAPLFRVAPCW